MKLTDRKKQQIILAAVEEFHENGFAGTSMDQIAQTADVSKRTVYNHFPSKDELYIGIVHHMFGMIAATSPEPYDPDKDFTEQLTKLVRKKIHLFVSEDFIRLSRVLLPEALHNPKKMQDSLSQMSTLESDMESWFESVIRDKSFTDDDITDVSNTLMGMLKMDSYWPRLLKGKEVPSATDIEFMVEKTVNMFVRYYEVAR